jgi:uncharacterized protein (DUF1778 family)
MERKSETVNLRVTQEFKELLRQAAEQEHRTVSNFIEALVRKHCAQGASNYVASASKNKKQGSEL